MRNHSAILGFVALAALTTFVHCAKKNATSERACSNTQALQLTGLRGSSLPPKTIALTFDDGPGIRTKSLSQYLKAEGIEAAFFINGKQMGPDADLILTQVVEDGHLVANHTETHKSFTGLATATPHMPDAEIVAEVEQTDAKIDKFIPSKRYLFRPPFGDWDDQSNNALTASTMNKYVGPILWDVGDRMNEAAGRVADWDCWQDGSDLKRLTVQQCGDLYITEIKHAGRGIVLMHDPYFNDLDPLQEGTVDMVFYMVPILKAEGYKFVRVDKVPDIEKLLPPVDPQANPPGGGPGGPGGDRGPEGQPGPADDPCD
jgi:peptidoglycan/xylan/chitin deacetylase (PgdA/CDA1 family)